MGTIAPSWYYVVYEWLRQPELDILQSCSDFASLWVKNIELESLSIALRTYKFTHAQLAVLCIFAAAVFGNVRQHLLLLVLPTSRCQVWPETNFICVFKKALYLKKTVLGALQGFRNVISCRGTSYRLL